MELKGHIIASGMSMLAQVKIINEIELYGRDEYLFLYGLNFKNNSSINNIKIIYRLWNR